MAMYVKLPRNDAVISSFGSYPVFLNVLDRKETAVQRHLRRVGAGGYEPAVQSVILAAVQASTRRTFYDVGAHIGYYSALIGSTFRGTQVVAFEPTLATAEICQNIRDRNNLNYVIVKRALSDAETTLSFYISPKAETSNSLNSTFRPGAGLVTVEATTIDKLVDSGFPLPGVIKIDVETHESAVLRGGLGVIAKARPTLICEFLPAADPVEIRAALISLNRIGYSFHAILEDRVAGAADTSAVMAAIASGKRRDWFLAPNKPSAAFATMVSEWRVALQKCGSETLEFTDAGLEPPALLRTFY